MKTFQLSDDRMVTAKKNLVTIKQKNSDKALEFTPTRYLLCSIMFHSTTPIPSNVNSLYHCVLANSLAVAVLLQMGRFPSDVRGNRYRSQAALRRRTSQVPGAYRWWTPVVTNVSTSARSTFHMANWTSNRPRRASLYVSTNGPT